MPYIDPGFGDFVVVDGQIVERQTLYLVEKIKESYPNVEVVCLDPDRADSPFEEPFLICERVGDQLFKIFGCWELNDSILERLHLADTTKHDIQKIIDDNNARVRKEQEDKAREESEAAKDLIKHIAANRTSSYSYKREDGTKVTFHEDRPAEVK